MSRPFAELLRDVESTPSNWEVIRTETKPSLNRKNQGGTSIQEFLRHRTTGEEIVRHTLLKPDGTLFAEAHFRPHWKGTP